jgi:hypothetical protein
MTATYLILLDLKSRNKSIRILSNRIQQITCESTNEHVPINLLREKNQQDKTHLPPISGMKSINNEHRNRKHKTPNKENSQTQRQERTTPTVK